MKPIAQAIKLFTDEEILEILRQAANRQDRQDRQVGSIAKIAKQLGHSPKKIGYLFYGYIAIPTPLHSTIRTLGFRLCSACHFRLVPPFPIGTGGVTGRKGTQLIRLCYHCYRTGETTGEAICHINIEKGDI